MRTHHHRVSALPGPGVRARCRPLVRRDDASRTRADRLVHFALPLVDDATQVLQQQRFAHDETFQMLAFDLERGDFLKRAYAPARLGSRVSAVRPKNEPSFSVLTGTIEPSALLPVSRTLLAAVVRE